MPLCAICGLRESASRDHVPPKAIFPRPRPNNLITVPACFECNNGASDYDDLFKVFLSLQASAHSEIAERLFNENTIRTLERNQRLLNTIREESRQLEVTDANGQLTTATGILWNSEAHDSVIERTIRGLYFHHQRIIMPENCELRVQFLRGIPENIDQFLGLMQEVEIGDRQVVYKYYIHQDDPRHSMWLFNFYNAHWASGYTKPT
ncbi:MAG: hypothetical protein HRT54_07950 [Colwellia sp.]|nr:hypothetical protein [Colwellia sp.]